MNFIWGYKLYIVSQREIEEVGRKVVVRRVLRRDNKGGTLGECIS